MTFRSFLLSAVLLVLCLTGLTQSDSSKAMRFFGFPVVFRLPETSWGFGAAGILTFKMNRSDSVLRASQLTLGGAYTLNNQILLYLPADLFFKSNQYWITCEVGYYRYNFFYYGVGSELPASNEEEYGVNFPRVKLGLRAKVRPDAYLGLRYWMDDFDITYVKEGGLLDTSSVPGANGGLISGLGPEYVIDKREHPYYPYHGFKAEGAVQYYHPALGSEFRYLKSSVDFTWFTTVFQDKDVFGFNAYVEDNLGTVPFNALGLLGGNQLMRGYYEGRYRDKKFVTAQIEYRLPLFWRIGVVGFMASGIVAPEWQQMQIKNMKPAGGLGLRVRVNDTDRFNLRVDYAVGIRSSAAYVTIGEAF